MNDLEAKFSFQEDTLGKLSDAFASQQKQLSDIRHELDVLKQHLVEVLQSQSSLEGAAPSDEKPPHY